MATQGLAGRAGGVRGCAPKIARRRMRAPHAFADRGRPQFHFIRAMIEWYRRGPRRLVANVGPPRALRLGLRLRAPQVLSTPDGVIVSSCRADTDIARGHSDERLVHPSDFP